MDVKKTRISFSDAARLVDRDDHAPFLCGLGEQGDNELRLVINGSKLGNVDGDAAAPHPSPSHGGNAALDGILRDCRPIEPGDGPWIELVFEDYIIYQVRNESYCSYDPSEVRIGGKYLVVFEKSALLDYLSVSTDAQQWDDGGFFPYRWRHYGVRTQNQVIDIVSRADPRVYRYDPRPGRGLSN